MQVRLNPAHDASGQVDIWLNGTTAATDYLTHGSFPYEMPGMVGLQLLGETNQRFPAVPGMMSTALPGSHISKTARRFRRSV